MKNLVLIDKWQGFFLFFSLSCSKFSKKKKVYNTHILNKQNKMQTALTMSAEERLLMVGDFS